MTLILVSLENKEESNSYQNKAEGEVQNASLTRHNNPSIAVEFVFARKSLQTKTNDAFCSSGGFNKLCWFVFIKFNILDAF